MLSSLLYQVTTQVLRGGGAPGCSQERAHQLNVLAERTLPTEEESVDPTLQNQWWSDRKPIESRPLEDIIPLPRRKGRGIRTWAVGITTAPRETPTLEYCQRSLEGAGWEEMHLFVDGSMELPADLAALPATVRRPAVGIWPNYYLSLLELSQRYPDADALMIAQDDALFLPHPEVRTHLEQALWQGRSAQLASLFCPGIYTQPTAGWHRAEHEWGLGPVALVFSREAALQFLSDPFVQSFERVQRSRGQRGIDGMIGRWAASAGVPIYYPTPSLVQHIGHTSTIWKNAPAFGRRRASRFGASRAAPDR